MRPVIQEAKERYVNSKIKKHFVDNKKVYLTGAVCLVVGVLVAKQGDVLLSSIEGNDNKTIVAKAKHVTLVTAELERRGHPGNVVMCKETGEVFASQRRAAEMLGINPGEISKHVRGLTDNAGGYTFESLGEAA